MNFSLRLQDSDTLVVILAPMNLPLQQLPHFKSADRISASKLLINPGNSNFYLDCVFEVINLISEALISAKATKLIFCGSSMGGYGALMLGPKFEETVAIFSFAPAFRLDHPYSRSMLQIEPCKLTNDGDVTGSILSTKAQVFIFLPCYDHQDGVNISDALDIQRNNKNISINYLSCEHDVNNYLSLPDLVDFYIKKSFLPEENISPLRASLFEAQISAATYSLYCQDHGIAEKISYEEYPTEETNNWRYFYWKARHLSKSGKKWQSVQNFLAAMEKGGAYVSDVHICLANTYKDIGFKQVALGHYEEALKIRPNDPAIISTIQKL